MPIVSVDNLPLYERAIFGFDGTDYRVVRVNSSGQLVLALAAGSAIQANSYGLISGAQQRDPLRFGYSGDQTEQIVDLNAAAGTNLLVSTAVPAGEIWLLQAVAALDNTNAPTEITLYCLINGIVIALVVATAPVVSVAAIWTGQIVLSAGDTIIANFAGVTLNDDLYLRYHAVRVDIDQ